MRATSTILKSSDVTQQYVDWLNDPDVNKYLESRFTYQDNKKVTEFGFKQLKLVKIMAGCYGANIGSKKAFEKSGYRVEGFFRSHVESTNGRDDLWEMSCFESDFSVSKHK